MSFDFFADNIGSDSAVKFSKQENEFFESRLNFLDPKKTGVIGLGNALQLLKYSSLGSEVYQKILRNCKLQGKKSLTHDEMKKVLRGIALAQNHIEPSAININANIKTKMPVFHDDSEDEEQEEVQKPKPPPTKPPQQPMPPQMNQNIQQSQQIPQIQQSQQIQQSGKENQKMNSPPTQPNSNPLQDFDRYWLTLSTKDNRIDGNQVKKLFASSNGNRSNLAKAWKICNLQSRNSLSKGQLYVFLQIIKFDHIPEGLTAEMKGAIAHIDKTSQPTQPKPARQSNLQGSALFDAFGKTEKSLLQPQQQPKTNQARNPSFIQHVQKDINSATQVLNQNQQSYQQELKAISNQNESLSLTVEQMEQFLNLVTNKNNELRQYMDQLKESQLQLNNKLNNVCLSMKNVIVRQNGMIEELMGELNQQNGLNQQRVSVLEGYVQGVELQLQNKFKNKEGEQKMRRNSVSSSQSIQNNLKATPRSSASQNFFQKEEHKEQSRGATERTPTAQKIQKPAQAPSLHVQQQQQHQQSSQNQQPKQQQPSQMNPASQINTNPTPEQIEYQNRMKMKQMQVIQLIHYLNPIVPEEYPELAQKIIALDEETLNKTYASLYQNFLERQQAEQAEQQRASLASNRSQNNPSSEKKFPDENEFNTSRFHAEEQQQVNDFFN